MTRAWQTVDAVDTEAGLLELRRRGDADFLISIDGRVLMNSAASRSEEALGELASRAVADHGAPRVLIGGLGMGFTLRAALDALPATAEVVVAELTPAVASWCEGPLAILTDNAALDPRTRIEIADVVQLIETAAMPGAKRFDAIALDLYEGPHAGRNAARDPCFGDAALRRTRDALATGGVFALWTEHRDPGFERRLGSAGFDFDVKRPGRGGLRHAVYLARARSTARRGGRERSIR